MLWLLGSIQNCPVLTYILPMYVKTFVNSYTSYVIVVWFVTLGQPLPCFKTENCACEMLSKFEQNVNIYIPYFAVNVNLFMKFSKRIFFISGKWIEIQEEKLFFTRKITLFCWYKGTMVVQWLYLLFSDYSFLQSD